MKKGEFFPYSWHVDKQEEDFTAIRIYGLNKKNENVCIKVDNFTPYVYLELPEYTRDGSKIRWTEGRARLVKDKLNSLIKERGGRPPCWVPKLSWKKKLYGAYLDSDTGKRKLFPYLWCAFKHTKDIKNLWFTLKKFFRVTSIGLIKLKMHESDATPILQLGCCRKLPTAGWIQFFGKQTIHEGKLTLCDHEYTVRYKNLKPSDNRTVPKPLIMGFDIEVYSKNPSKFPNAEKRDDEVFQISCIIAREGDPPKDYEKYLLSLGDPEQSIVGDDVIIYTYETEELLLLGFTQLIREENPNIIVGYNILGFDIPYMIKRCNFEMHRCNKKFSKQGFHKSKVAEKKTIKWSSSAYRNQEFEFLDAEGRLYVDLLPLVRRDFKFNNYKLKTISTYFLGQTKDPLTPKGIFKCYKIGMNKNSKGEYGRKAKKAMGVVGKYCIQDSVLVVRLMEKLKTWVGLTEMAKTCNVPIFTLYTQGQQIKVYSQLYKYCMYQNIVVETDVYKVSDDERYIGAKVFLPVPGKYKMIVPFDFASLYPTTIIAYNIDYHTWVPEDSCIPDSRCHVMKWEDHQNCEHDPKVKRKIALTLFITKEREEIKAMRERRNKCLDKLRRKEMMVGIKKALDELRPYTVERSELVKSISKFSMCAKRRYRFLKEPKGVMPTVIQNLLDARKHTRKVDMAKVRDEIKRLENEEKVDNTALIQEQKSLLDVLNKRQLSFKKSANSMYGAMGVRKGYLPFMPGAMCTCYMGRVNIERVAKTITEEYKGDLIYGDTDSNYLSFPHLTTAKETWDYALQVADEVSKLFPDPIKLEFEEEIYVFFLILSKKRYMYRKCLRDGVVDDKIGKKGVLLARRDNSKFVRDVYEEVVNMIANHKEYTDVLYYILSEINKMCSRSKPYTDFIITKAVGSHGGLVAQAFQNEKGIRKAKVGDYTVPILSIDKETREEQMKKKGASTPREYYLLCLPAQVQLAERMSQRGKPVDTGTRLEYIVTDPDRHTAKQYEKIESAEYLARHSDLILIDYMYYLKALVNPMDQVLDVTFKAEKGFKPGFVKSQYKFRWKVRQKMLKEIITVQGREAAPGRALSRPKIMFYNK